MALQGTDGAACDQRIAVYAQELVRVFFFQLAECAVQNMAVGRRAHRHVFEFGLEVEHLRQRHAQGLATVLNN